MKYWVLILAPTFLLINTPDIRAHTLITVNGNSEGHQHVYRRQQYGKPLQQGHRFQSPGGGSMILWRAGTRSDYGKLNVHRSRSITDDHKHKRDPIPGRSKKYGEAVNGYGKPYRD